MVCHCFLTMLERLPPEVLLIIAENLSFCEIMAIRSLNTRLHDNTDAISEYVITRELSKYDNLLSKDDISYQVYFLFYDTYQKLYSSIASGYTKYSPKNSLEINNNVLRQIDYCCISINPYINRLFQHLLRHYVEYRTLEDYPNKYAIFLFYNLYQVDVLKNIKNINYNVRFLNDFYNFSEKKNTCLYTSIYNYYYYILSSHFPINICSLHTISKYIVSIHTLKKLFGIKRLDLPNAKYVTCCDDNVYEMINAIVTYKYNLQTDIFLYENYIKIKEFFAGWNEPVLEIFREQELMLINSHIVFKHPFNKSNMRLNSKSTQRLLFHLRYERGANIKNKKILGNLEHFIQRRQTELVEYYFGNITF